MANLPILLLIDSLRQNLAKLSKMMIIVVDKNNVGVFEFFPTLKVLRMVFYCHG